MARPLRIEFPGACYHLMCRGNFRFPVFQDPADKALILERLIHFAEIFHVRIRAYCVMVNHLHGHLQTQEANMGRFMHSFLTSFSRLYNDRHTTSGHVFQGRYKALLVEDDSAYCANVSRYIHLNPACTREMKDADFEIRRQAARAEKWSSYAAIIGLRPCPRWLHRNDFLDQESGKTLSERQKAYASFVEQSLTGDIWNPEEAAAAQLLVGSDSFVERMRRRFGDLSPNLEIRRENIQQRALHGSHSLGEVIAIVAAHFHCAPEYLRRPNSQNNHPRQVLLYLASVYCRSQHTLCELAHSLGPISLSGLDSARQRLKAQLGQSAKLREEIAQLEAKLAGKADNHAA
jgi:REP element-mobilizing transposase RayT